MQNKNHKKVVAGKNLYLKKIQAWFIFEMTTDDAFVANNPIDFTVYTRGIDVDLVSNIELRFEGAQKVVLMKEPFIDDKNRPRGHYDEVHAKYRYMSLLEQHNNAKRDAKNSNVMLLINDNIKRLTGQLQNVVYPAGGKFDVGVTVRKKDGEVIGFDCQRDRDSNYILVGAVEVSPPEVLLQIKNNNLITGLAWIGVGLVPVAIALTGILEIIKLAFG